MENEKSERTRMVFECDERIRRGIKIAAAETGKTVREIIVEAIEQFIPEHLKKAEVALAKENPSEKTTRKK